MITKLQWSHGRLLKSAANFTKLKKNNKYFWVFKFKTRTERNKQTKQNLFGFLNNKLKLKGKAKLIMGTKETNKEKQRKYFWSFCVVESENKTRIAN